MTKNKWFLNGSRGSGRTIRLLCETYENKIADLEKENAELKKKNLDAQDAVTMQMYTNRANKEIADKQLAKAKELISGLNEGLDKLYLSGLSEKQITFVEQLQDKIEQFLNSEVEK